MPGRLFAEAGEVGSGATLRPRPPILNREVATLDPASSRNRCTKAATRKLSIEGVAPKNPMVGSLPGCCARAANGHVAATPPSSVMNWRRFIQSPPSARSRRACGTVRPSALAVLRLSAGGWHYGDSGNGSLMVMLELAWWLRAEGDLFVRTAGARELCATIALISKAGTVFPMTEIDWQRGTGAGIAVRSAEAEHDDRRRQRDSHDVCWRR
jgi:hypothetical protein